MNSRQLYQFSKSRPGSVNSASAYYALLSGGEPELSKQVVRTDVVHVIIARRMLRHGN
ncbi:MAG: hypothetical protein ACI909_003208 [Planctomycetota bacterium]|jgi:hypothetical protein